MAATMMPFRPPKRRLKNTRRTIEHWARIKARKNQPGRHTTPSGLAYSIIKNFVQLSTANSTFLVSLLVCLVICPTRIAAAMVPSRTPLRWPRNTSDSTTALQDDFSQEKKVQNQIYLNIEQDRLHNVSGLC